MAGSRSQKPQVGKKSLCPGETTTLMRRIQIFCNHLITASTPEPAKPTLQPTSQKEEEDEEEEFVVLSSGRQAEDENPGVSRGGPVPADLAAAACGGLKSIWQVERHPPEHLSHSDSEGLQGGRLSVRLTTTDPDPLSSSPGQVASDLLLPPPPPSSFSLSLLKSRPICTGVIREIVTWLLRPRPVKSGTNRDPTHPHTDSSVAAQAAVVTLHAACIATHDETFQSRPSHLSPLDATEQRGNRGPAAQSKAPIADLHLCVFAAVTVTLSRQEIYTAPQGSEDTGRGGCHGNGPLPGCEDWLIIQDHHR
ncbi:unnamed protein product [Pleuronectes platessa]|uniref:Uncharacterized protein n=1 Tax=Pleuronectes platessa TaxID=8262 RepID=A0A9N7VFV7_PLEPL|nr:unnamed protein product [Pleuronectes platessa]